MFLGGDLYSVSDARCRARRRLPWMFFDYIDGAAGEETGAEATRQAFDALHLMPRILSRSRLCPRTGGVLSHFL